MRLSAFAGGVMFLVSAALPVLAQTNYSPTFFGGANPQNLTFTPIDVTKAIRPVNFGADSNFMYKPMQPTSTFNATTFYPKISVGTWPPSFPQFPKLGSFQLPTLSIFRSNK